MTTERLRKVRNHRQEKNLISRSPILLLRRVTALYLMHLQCRLPVLLGLACCFLSIAVGLTLPINGSYAESRLAAQFQRHGPLSDQSAAWNMYLQQGSSALNHTEGVDWQSYAYKIPDTLTTLLITRGRPVERRKARSFLLETMGDVMYQTNRHGRLIPLPNGAYDDEDNGLEFSAYSPEELEKESKLTWGILKDVVSGVFAVVISEIKLEREINFRILHGENNRFTGYGFFKNERPSNKG
ncbi:MAG: hypothetical protein Q9191_001813 [Dirinaria sp. TL-2023a]